MNTPRRIRDIAPGFSSSNPLKLTVLGSSLFFTANDGSGVELWKSDGTSTGTVRVRDINPGSGDAAVGNLKLFGSNLFFRAWDGSSGSELWKSDGSSAGTVRIRDINPGSIGSYPGGLTVLGSSLFFTATDGSSGQELWKSDGSSAGTVRVRDINPGFNTSYPMNFTVLGSTLFFRANGGSSGTELWKSDGTSASTVLVRDINPEPAGAYPLGSSFPSDLTVLGSTLFFTAKDGSSGRELWKSDGTNTVRVRDIDPGSGSSDPYQLTVLGSTLFFSADDGSSGSELWKSDGTNAGTVRVRDINPGSGNAAVGNFTVFGSTLFFTANDGSSGDELWKTDGTSAGTVLVRDINPGSGNSAVDNFTVFGSTLFFTAFDGSSGIELWRSDGTSAGTVRVTDINPGSSSSSPRNLTVLGNTLFFSASDGSSGDELWALDISDLLPAISLSVIPASVSEDGAANLHVLFTRNDPAGQLLNLLPELSIRYSVSGSASAADYSGAAPGSGRTITFAPGSTLAILSIDPNADTSFEPDETVIVTLESGADYVLSAQTSAAAVILNDDPDYSFGPITINGVNLGSTSLGYALRNSGGAPIQVTYPSGNASASNPGNGWNAVAAAPSGSGYSFYWRNSTSAQLAFWSLDSTGAYTSGYLLTDSQVFAEEAKLNLDLNGDGYSSGPITINGLNLGTTSQGYALRSAGAVPIQITYPGGNASANNPGSGWGAVAAAAIGSGYAFYWRNSGSGQTVRWELNSTGAYTSGYFLSAAQLLTEEANLNLDLNGDGYTSGATTINGVNLGSTILGYALRNGSSTPIQVTYPGGNASGSNPGNGWTAVAAAAIGSGYAFYWRNSGSGQTARWDLNSSGAYTSGYFLSASQLISEEANLNLDLNGDGYTSGARTISGVNLGSTSLGYALRSSTGSPIQVTYPGGNASASNPGNNWVALAAVSIPMAKSFAFYWRNNSSGETARWNLNAVGVYQNGRLLTASELINEEVTFNADLNGDAIIGAAFSTIESQGNTSLLRRNDGMAYVEAGGKRTAVASPFGLGTGDTSTTWQMLAAETIGEKNQILWRNNPGNFLHVWSLDASWSWQSSAGNISPASPEALGLETSFQIDLNGNGVIG